MRRKLRGLEQGALNSKVVGSIPTRHTKIAPVAQLDRAPAYEAGG